MHIHPPSGESAFSVLREVSTPYRCSVTSSHELACDVLHMLIASAHVGPIPDMDEEHVEAPFAHRPCMTKKWIYPLRGGFDISTLVASAMAGARSALLFVLLLVTLNLSGCIGLVPARELMESMRDPPEDHVVVQRHSINHTFTSPGGFDDSITFEVSTEVTGVTVYFFTDLPASDVIDTEQIRYVDASLEDASGSVIWSNRTGETARPPIATLQLEDLTLGRWTLTVDAQGFGESVVQLAQDTFIVTVTLESVCRYYPPEDPAEVC